MAIIGNKDHILAYNNLPKELKRELFTEFNQLFPSITRWRFNNWALGRQPFPTLAGEWVYFIKLLKKYNKILEEQCLES